MKEVSSSKFFRISAKTNGRCFYCNLPAEEIDHFVPRKLWNVYGLDDGTYPYSLNGVENLFPTCRTCNSKKRAKAPEDFIGNSFTAWSRYNRANKRIGIPSEDQWPTRYKSPFHHYEWKCFIEKYG
jgi:hypothetical protein